MKEQSKKRKDKSFDLFHFLEIVWKVGKKKWIWILRIIASKKNLPVKNWRYHKGLIGQYFFLSFDGFTCNKNTSCILSFWNFVALLFRSHASKSVEKIVNIFWTRAKFTFLLLNSPMLLASWLLLWPFSELSIYISLLGQKASKMIIYSLKWKLQILEFLETTHCADNS